MRRKRIGQSKSNEVGPDVPVGEFSQHLIPRSSLYIIKPYAYLCCSGMVLLLNAPCVNISINSNLPIQAFSARRSPSPIVPDSPPREPSDTGDAELEPEPLSEKHAREAQAVIDVFGLKMVPKKFCMLLAM